MGVEETNVDILIFPDLLQPVWRYVENQWEEAVMGNKLRLDKLSWR